MIEVNGDTCDIVDALIELAKYYRDDNYLYPDLPEDKAIGKILATFPGLYVMVDGESMSF